MGKLTDSLKAATQQLSDIQDGVRQMREIGDEMSNNTLRVAEAALRTGYAYAKAEEDTIAEFVDDRSSQKALPEARSPETQSWTPQSLKAEFGKLNVAYQYLKETYGVKLSRRSWQAVAEALNRAKEAPKPRSIEARVLELEKTVSVQTQYISKLEQQLNSLLDRVLKLESKEL
ncbi:MAG: hypothetical protein J7641_04435 [Cyanobacteria bacterium SID2]|nr:hypothetical protein [Cyanobacteria bacterium SID2]MBP0002447.1 hypothetical protein [Cyanobacteria bacterium SBC]